MKHSHPSCKAFILAMISTSSRSCHSQTIQSSTTCCPMKNSSFSCGKYPIATETGISFTYIDIQHALIFYYQSNSYQVIECFLLNHKYNRFIAFSLTDLMKIQPSMWMESEMQMLWILMDYSPNILPCNTTITYHKPCQEVLHLHLVIGTQNVSHLALVDIQTPSRSAKDQKEHWKLLAHPTQLDLPPLWSIHRSRCRNISDYPCSHPGPCDGWADCACFLNMAHCKVAFVIFLVRFPLSYWLHSYNKITTGPHKQQGWHCKKDVTGKLCYSARCPCCKAHRETIQFFAWIAMPGICLSAPWTSFIRSILDAKVPLYEKLRSQR